MFNKLINKQTVISFIIGAVFFSALPIKAAIEELRIYANPYPVIVNGTNQPVEGYNINDYTYLKLADIGKVLSADIKFNQVTSNIEINTVAAAAYSKVETVSIPSSVVLDSTNKNPKTPPQLDTKTKLDNTQWIELKDLAKEYNYSYYQGRYITLKGNNKILILDPDLFPVEESKIVSVKTEFGYISVQVVYSFVYLNINDLRNIGIIS